MNILDPQIESCIRQAFSFMPLTQRNQEIFREYILLPDRDDEMLSRTEPQNNFSSFLPYFYHPIYRLWATRDSHAVMDRFLEFLWAVGGTDTANALIKANGQFSTSDGGDWRAQVLGNVPAAFLCAATAFESVHLKNRFVKWLAQIAVEHPGDLLEAQGLCDNFPHAFALLSGVLLAYAKEETIKPFQREKLVENTIDAVPRILFGLPISQIRQMQEYIEKGDLSVAPPVLPSLQLPAVDIESAQFATWQAHLLLRTHAMAALLAAKEDPRLHCALRFFMMLHPRQLFYDAMAFLPKASVPEYLPLLRDVLPGGGITLILFAVHHTEHFKLCRATLPDTFDADFEGAMEHANPEEYLYLIDHEKHALSPAKIREKMVTSLVKCTYQVDEDLARAYLTETGSLEDTAAKLRNVRPGLTKALDRCVDLLRDYIHENGMDDFSVRCAAFTGTVFHRSWLEYLCWMKGGKTDPEILPMLTRRFSECGLPTDQVLMIWDRDFESTYNDDYKANIRKAALAVADPGRVRDIAGAMKQGSVFLRSVALEMLADLSAEPGAKGAILASAGDSSKQIREQVRNILGKHPEWTDDCKSLLNSKKAAVRQLAVEVLGSLGEREALEAALANEKNAKVADAIRAVLGAEAASVSSGDDLAAELIKGNKLKKLTWLLNAALPALHKKDGTEAGETVRNAILVSYSELGRIGRSDTAAQLTAELDALDLEKLAVRVYDIWYADGAQAKHKWVLPFAAVYGGAAITTRLTRAIHDWPEHQRGAIACDAVMALALSSDPAAIVIVDSISRKFKFRQVKTAAAQALENAATELGISAEELADRIVPDLGFGRDGKRTFDYGKRSFTVRLTATLELAITNDQGKAVKSMPAPGKTDDPQAEDAYEAFKTMKKQIKTTVTAQRARLEAALSVLRCWDTDRWKALFVDNPIMHQFAMSLIWGIYEDGKLTDTFRYMEDGTFNTVDEDEFTLPEQAQIGLVHPVELDEETLEGWKQQLEDYEIRQSIDQLSRTIHILDGSRAEEKVLEDFGGKQLNALSLSGKMLGHGWYRGSVQDGGAFYCFWREDKALGIGAELRFSGTSVGYDDGENVTVYDAVFYMGTVNRGSYVYDTLTDEQIIPLGQVPRRYYSEIVHHLTRATASSTEHDADWKKNRHDQ